MTATAGALRLFDWKVPEKAAEAHAFNAGTGIPFRSLCEVGRWTIKATAAQQGTPLCQVCMHLVAGAARRATEEMNALAPQLRLEGIEQYQAESR